MIKRIVPPTRALAAMLAIMSVGVRGAPIPTIPSTFVLPSSAADTSKPGFIWRISQVADVGNYVQNSIARAEAQLAGLLGDNLADPAASGIASGPASAPVPSSAPIEFVIPTVINLDKAGGSHGNITPDDQMPGAPGTDSKTDNQAAEILTWLDLPVGDISMGVNSDDGFQMSIGGSTPIDRFAINVGEFDGSRGAADTLFKFHITQAGLYPVRVIWENGGGDSNIEWFSVLPDGTTDVGINDVGTPGAIKAYRAAAAPVRAYASTFTPGPSSIVSPDTRVNIVLVDGAAPIQVSSIKLTLDGTVVNATVTKTNKQTTIVFQPASIFESASTHLAQLVYSDSGSPATTTTNSWTFSVVTYRKLVLPAPLYFENFESVAKGGIPIGWTATNNTDRATGTSDIGDPKSDLYLNWLVIDRDQVYINGTNEFKVWEAGDPDGRVSHIAPGQIVNGVVLNASNLMESKFLYAESDERGGNQLQVIFTPDYNLTGKSNLWVSFHSSYIQNQDSLGGLEYSVDAGGNWLPLLYMLDVPDIALREDGSVDAETTLNRDQTDTAYSQPYGAFIAAPISSNLAPYISGRINDNSVESHRVEAFPLPKADNKSQVRFRFVQAGTGSWYWGLDDFGIYSIPPVSTNTVPPVAVAAVRSGDDLKITWTGGTGPFLVQTSAGLGAPWLDTVTTADRTVTLPLVGGAGFIRVIDGTTKTVQLFKAHLDSQQEPNKPVSSGKGAGIAVLDGLNLTYYLSYEGLGSGISAAHIHNGAVGVNGGVFVPFTPVVGTQFGIISGVATLTAAQKDFITTGAAYFNIHTTVNGGGEIRGQLLP